VRLELDSGPTEQPCARHWRDDQCHSAAQHASTVEICQVDKRYEIVPMEYLRRTGASSASEPAQVFACRLNPRRPIVAASATGRFCRQI
jgi:hypothetical protein